MPLYSTAAHPAYNSGGGVIEYDVPLTAATATTAGGVVALANPFGVDLIIISAQLDIQTAATTNTNTVSIGVAANGTTSATNLFNATAAAQGITGTTTPRKWTSGQYVTGTASATLVGMVAILHIQAVRA